MVDSERECPLCGANRAHIILAAIRQSGISGSYRLLQCSSCEMRFTDPLPDPAKLENLYHAEYYGSAKSPLLSWDSLRTVLHWSILLHRRHALIGRRPGRVLDIGCGDGDFLAFLARRGWEVYGTDFSSAACSLARARGNQVHHGSLVSAEFPSGFFDVVTLWHVLEHLPDVSDNLTEVHRVLRDDGMLVVEVPDSGSLTFRLCRERWFPLDIPRHLQHFTASTINRMLRRSGFDCVRYQHLHHLDFVLAFMSFMDLLGVLGQGGHTHYFVTDFRRASTWSRLLFLSLGFLVGLCSFPYSFAATILRGNGETLTVTAHKRQQ
jgi:2-polyprenyl-3-methyl-5-hydroxy-6-metoxy-1,4-benzoquinol methylase